jgi:hypothetical protein
MPCSLRKHGKPLPADIGYHLHSQGLWPISQVIPRKGKKPRITTTVSACHLEATTFAHTMAMAKKNSRPQRTMALSVRLPARFRRSTIRMATNCATTAIMATLNVRPMSSMSAVSKRRMAAWTTKKRGESRSVLSRSATGTAGGSNTSIADAAYGFSPSSCEVCDRLKIAVSP